jgi:AP-2 complex subunit mu-1
MLSGILVFNQKGENLIFRAFRSDCRPRLADIFRIQVISNPQLRSPTLTLGSTTFSHVKHENIYLVAVTKSNANAALVFEFLYRLIALGKGYFGKFDEEAVKNNFVLVYELLDGELWRCCSGGLLLMVGGYWQRYWTLGILKIQRQIPSRCILRRTTFPPL